MSNPRAIGAALARWVRKKSDATSPRAVLGGDATFARQVAISFAATLAEISGTSREEDARRLYAALVALRRRGGGGCVAWFLSMSPSSLDRFSVQARLQCDLEPWVNDDGADDPRARDADAACALLFASRPAWVFNDTVALDLRLMRTWPTERLRSLVVVMPEIVEQRVWERIAFARAPASDWRIANGKAGVPAELEHLQRQLARLLVAIRKAPRCDRAHLRQVAKGLRERGVDSVRRAVDAAAI